MRIYLASNWQSKKRMRDLAVQVRLLGHTVQSDWLEDPTTDYLVDSPMDAWQDLAQIWLAELLIVDTAEASVTGGREVELGYAMGLETPTWVVGPKRNIFHGIATRHFDTWTDVLQALAPHAAQ